MINKILKKNSNITKELIKISISEQISALKNNKRKTKIGFGKDASINDMLEEDPLLKTKYKIEKIINSTKNRLSCILSTVGRKTSNQRINNAILNSKTRSLFAKIYIIDVNSSEYLVSNILEKKNSHKITNFVAYHLRIGFEIYVYEYFDDYVSLKSILDKNPSKNERKKMFIEILFGTLECLEFLHENNIIHCDINPGNILVKKNSFDNVLDKVKQTLTPSVYLKNNNNIKLCNFSRSQISIGKYLVNENSSGTINYQPPESYMISVFSLKNDVWSLGITLYQILLNDLPFKYSPKTNLEQEKIIFHSVSYDTIKEKLINLYCKGPDTINVSNIKKDKIFKRSYTAFYNKKEHDIKRFDNSINDIVTIFNKNHCDEKNKKNKFEKQIVKKDTKILTTNFNKEEKKINPNLSTDMDVYAVILSKMLSKNIDNRSSVSSLLNEYGYSCFKSEFQ